MSKSYELTPVFDGAKDLPVRKGWYPTAWKSGDVRLWSRRKWPLRYWDGHRFYSVFPNERLLWCGLTTPYRK